MLGVFTNLTLGKGGYYYKLMVQSDCDQIDEFGLD